MAKANRSLGAALEDEEVSEQRCAECTCKRGGIRCNWIASTPQEYSAEIAKLDAEVARLRGELAAMGRENNRLRYGPQDFGGALMQDVLADAVALAEAAEAALAEAREQCCMCGKTGLSTAEDGVMSALDCRGNPVKDEIEQAKPAP